MSFSVNNNSVSNTVQYGYANSLGALPGHYLSVKEIVRHPDSEVLFRDLVNSKNTARELFFILNDLEREKAGVNVKINTMIHRHLGELREVSALHLEYDDEIRWIEQKLYDLNSNSAIDFDAINFSAYLEERFALRRYYQQADNKYQGLLDELMGRRRSAGPIG